MYHKIFENFWFRKKKSPSKMKRKFWKIQFLKEKLYWIIFFCVKFDFRMFSAFIWCIYCPCRSKMTNFQKLYYRKLKNFRGQSRLLQRRLTAKPYNLGWCSKTLHIDKDASYHLRPFLNDLHRNYVHRSMKTVVGWFNPPPAFWQPKYSGFLRVKRKHSRLVTSLGKQ